MTKSSPAEKQFPSGKSILDTSLKVMTGLGSTLKMTFWRKTSIKKACRIAQCMFLAKFLTGSLEENDYLIDEKKASSF